MREEIDEDDIRQHQCVLCVHLHEDKRRCCDAFPEGIPEEIVYERFDHRNAHEGDQGIRFEAKPGRIHPFGMFPPTDFQFGDHGKIDPAEPKKGDQ